MIAIVGDLSGMEDEDEMYFYVVCACVTRECDGLQLIGFSRVHKALHLQSVCRRRQEKSNGRGVRSLLPQVERSGRRRVRRVLRPAQEPSTRSRRRVHHRATTTTTPKIQAIKDATTDQGYNYLCLILFTVCLLFFYLLHWPRYLIICTIQNIFCQISIRDPRSC